MISKHRSTKPFYTPARSHPLEIFQLRRIAAPAGYEKYFERVVAAERLREVRALLAFTRIESPNDFGDLDEIPRERRAPICRKAPTWVPASEVRGEGLFLQFDEAEVRKWLKRTGDLNRSLYQAHRGWRAMRKLEPLEKGYPTLRFVLLHSFAHALIRQFSLECGYSAASLRERIFSRLPEEENGPMSGVLIYTSAPDSEGTLGGLVSLAEPRTLGRHIDQALEVYTYARLTRSALNMLLLGTGSRFMGRAVMLAFFSETFL